MITVKCANVLHIFEWVTAKLLLPWIIALYIEYGYYCCYDYTSPFHKLSIVILMETFCPIPAKIPHYMLPLVNCANKLTQQ